MAGVFRDTTFFNLGKWPPCVQPGRTQYSITARAGFPEVGSLAGIVQEFLACVWSLVHKCPFAELCDFARTIACDSAIVALFRMENSRLDAMGDNVHCLPGRDPSCGGLLRDLIDRYLSERKRNYRLHHVHFETAKLGALVQTEQMIPGKAAMLFGLCLTGVLFRGGFQTSVALAQAPPQSTEFPMDPCLESTCRDVPLRENLTAIDLHSKNLYKPYVRVMGIVGGFAQGAGIAGGVQVSTSNAIPHLQLRTNFLVSTVLDRRFDVEAILNTNGNRNHVDAWFSYMKRSNDFFGIGPQSSDRFRNFFDTDQRSYQASFYRDFTRQLQGGVFVQVMNTHSGLGNAQDPAITDSFSGLSNQSGLEWIPGLLSTTQILSYGGYVELDARDNSKDLTRGYDIYVRAASSDGMKTNAAFSDYSWLEGEIDARGYVPLLSSRTSLALRSRGQFKNPRGGSQIPFYDLSYLGGREYVRGYQSYRFRDNDLLMFSAELRQTVYKKTDHRGVDVFAFADSGQTWGDARSSIDTSILAIQHFSFSSWHSGVGGGIQYRHSTAFAARLEAARSNEGVKFYASISRGF
jgi:Omp85 superfamily domain